VANPRDLKWITASDTKNDSVDARGIAKGFGVRLPKSITGTFGQRAVGALPEFLRKALTGLLGQIDALSREITGYDQQIGVLAGQHPELARLESIPGVGRLTAITFVLTLGRAERFAHSRDVAGFLGLRPKQRQSGARDPQLGSPRAAIVICASCWCSAHITF
jgi:transposase